MRVPAPYPEIPGGQEMKHDLSTLEINSIVKYRVMFFSGALMHCTFLIIFMITHVYLMMLFNFLSVASIVISATLGMASIASGLMGYLIRDMKAISRVALVIGGLLMVIPGTVTDLAGLAVLVAVLVLQRIENKKDKAAAV